MDAKEADNESELKFTVRNNFKDIFSGYLLISCLPPFLWVNLAFFLFNGYRGTAPLLQMKEYALVAFALAYNLLIVAVIFIIFMLVLIFSMFFTKKLKGVIGEHEYTFGPQGFSEKTAYNEHNLSYQSVVRFCETRKHYLLVMPSMNIFMLPKRDLSAEIREDLKKRFQAIKPLKKIIAPYAVLALIIASVISLVFASSMAKYTVITNAVPFRAVWDANALYISGGKTTTGQVLKYSDMLGIGTPSMSSAEPQSVTEQRLWVVRDGKTESYIIQTAMQPMMICLNDGKLYALHFDMQTRKKMLSYFTPDAFVEDPGRSPEEVMKTCNSEESHGKEGAFSAISFYEWDGKVGAGKTLQIPLGGALYGLGMMHEEATRNSDQGLFGDAESGTISLIGHWITEQTKKPETLYSVTGGMKTVDKETYQRYFH